HLLRRPRSRRAPRLPRGRPPLRERLLAVPLPHGLRALLPPARGRGDARHRGRRASRSRGPARLHPGPGATPAGRPRGQPPPVPRVPGPESLRDDDPRRRRGRPPLVPGERQRLAAGVTISVLDVATLEPERAGGVELRRFLNASTVGARAVEGTAY